MKKDLNKRIILLTSLIILLILISLSCKNSPQRKEEPAQQTISAEASQSEENLRLKEEISQKIVNTHTKILLIGLDAADWLIMDPLIEQGRLPHLARLKRKGAWGNLQSSPPLLSPIIWTSIGTGKPPEKHGIADFLIVDTRTGQQVPISRLSRKVKALWNIYSDFGLSADIIGWWATWPGERIHGHMVTERISYNLFNLSEEDFAEEGKTYPNELFQEIKPLIVAADDISYEETKNFIHISKNEYKEAWKEAESGKRFDNRINHLRKIIASTKTFHNISLHLLQKEQADLFSVYFEGIDTICHRFMLYMPPQLNRVSSEDFRMYRDAVENFYVFQDKLVGELLEAVGSETTVMVISDHGFYSGAKRPMSKPDDFTTGAPEWHQPIGIIILSGKWIKPGRIAGASIFDVTPTLLYLSGLPIPEDMIGKPLIPAISSEFKDSFPMTQIDSYEKVNPIRHEKVPRSSKIDKQRMEELRALGYIEGRNSTHKKQKASQESSPLQEDHRSLLTKHYNLGRNYLSKREFAKAEQEFKKTLSYDSNFQFGLYYLARTYQELDKTDEAIECLKKIISNSYDVFPLTYTLLTDIYVNRGELETAEKILQSALVLKKEVSEIHSSLGFINERKGHTKKAEDEYQRALELNPLDSNAVSQLISLYVHQNRPQEAENLIAKILSVPDVPTRNLNDIGLMCIQNKRYDLAEKIFKNILLKSPRSPGVMVNLGFCYTYQGKVAEAKSIFEKAVEEMPDNPKVLYNLAALYTNTGEFEKALEYYKKALEIGEGTPQIYNAMGKAYFRLGQKRNSLKILRKSLQLNPNQPDVKEMVQILEKELGGGNQ